LRGAKSLDILSAPIAIARLSILIHGDVSGNPHDRPESTMSPQSENHSDNARHHAAKSVQADRHADRAHGDAAHADARSQHHPDRFTWFAHETARLSGRPLAFIGATAIIMVWAATGPLFHYSDTWQLVINTGTTIVTFLMVFLIQNTQNRDTMTLQIKLAELIIAVRGAHNQVAAAEDMSDADLEALHAAYHKRATETMESLKRRRGTHASG
jgi:low affinity Fe/Cu permease